MSTYFWIVSGLTLVVAGICLIINNAQYQILKHLIAYLKQTVKQSLMRNGEPEKAWIVSKDDVPKLEKWYNECLNYGLINILALVSAIGLAMSGGFQILSYIAALLLATNIFFFPRALSRLNQAVEINNNYVLLMKAFEQVKTVDP